MSGVVSITGFKRADSSLPGTAERFYQEVAACMAVLMRTIAKLRRRYPDSAVAAALSMHTVSALSICIRDRNIIGDEARNLVLKIAALEFGELDFPRGQAQDH